MRQQAWAVQDRPKATLAINLIQDPGQKLEAVRGMAEGCRFDSLEEGMAWAGSLAEDLRPGALATVFSRQFDHQAEKSLTLLRQVEDPALRQDIFVQNLGKVALVNPELALSAARKDLSPQNFYYAASNMIGNSFTSENFDFYAGLVREIPVGKNRDEIALQLTQQYAVSHPENALEWLAENSSELNISQDYVSSAVKGIKETGANGGFIDWNGLLKWHCF